MSDVGYQALSQLVQQREGPGDEANPGGAAPFKRSLPGVYWFFLLQGLNKWQGGGNNLIKREGYEKLFFRILLLYAIIYMYAKQTNIMYLLSTQFDNKSLCQSKLEADKISCPLILTEALVNGFTSYTTFTLSWSVKNATTLATLLTCNRHETCFNRLRVKMHSLYINSESWTHEKIVKQKTQYTGNGIHVPFTLFAFLACPALAYSKFNTGIFNEWSTQRKCSIVPETT